MSSQHATVNVDRMVVIDHSSTSGTYVGVSRIASGSPVPIEPNAILAFGPVPVQVQLLVQLAQMPRPVLASGAMFATPEPQAEAPAVILAPPESPKPAPPPPSPEAPPPPPPPNGTEIAKLQPKPVHVDALLQATAPMGLASQALARAEAALTEKAAIDRGAARAPLHASAASAASPSPVASVANGTVRAPVSPPSPEARPAEARLAGAPGKKNKTVLGQLDFAHAAQQVKTIGRTPDNDIVISHPQVSSRHAFLHRVQGQLFVEDRSSANGTFVRGARIAPGQRIPVQSGEKIYIGPMPLQIEQSASGAAEIVQEEYSADRWAGRPLYEIEAWSLLLEVPDRDNPAEMKILLDNVSFKALPGDMIALMGPSGAGKTTLLLALNGYLPPSNGIVRINGEDLYNIYDNLRGSIGYVPQDDLVHAELTVFEAVKYSAKFRLPPDYSEDEIDARVEQTIKDLGLDGVKNLQIGKPEKKVLSGGQRKRVNIALELVTDPVILFLDEPTSGLAADDTTALITLLSDLTKQTGKTIIMTIHQPAKDEFEKFTHCLVMGYGGVPMFFGPTRDCYRFFGTWKERQRKPNDIDNPARHVRDDRPARAGRSSRRCSPRTATPSEAKRGATRRLSSGAEEFERPRQPRLPKDVTPADARSAAAKASEASLPRARPPAASSGSSSRATTR